MKRKLLLLVSLAAFAGCERPTPRQEPLVRVKCVNSHMDLQSWSDSRWVLYERMDTNERWLSGCIFRATKEGEVFSARWSEITVNCW